MIDGKLNVTNKGRQTTRVVIVSGVLFLSPFPIADLALLYFHAPPKKNA